MKNPGHFGRGTGSDRKSTHFYPPRPASGLAIIPRTISEVAEGRRLLAAEIGPARAGRQSGRGARKPKQAHILIAIAKFAHLFHYRGPGSSSLDIDDCWDAATGALHGWARQLLGRCGSYDEITPSRKGIRMLRPGDGG
jgi:hypothetical protein